MKNKTTNKSVTSLLKNKRKTTNQTIKTKALTKDKNSYKAGRNTNSENKAPNQKTHPINIHDAYFKLHFSQTEQAKNILKFALTKEEYKLFDWNSLKEEKDSFPNNKRADLVFSLAFKKLPNTKVKIYILLEHKAKKDKQVFRQLLFYRHQIIEREFFKTQKTPGVLTVVFYHGKSPWTGKVAFEEKSFKPSLKNKKIMSFLDKTMVEYRVRVLDIRQNPEIGSFLKKRGGSFREKKTQLALYILREIQGLSLEEVLDTGHSGFLSRLLVYLKGLPGKESVILLVEVVDYIEKKFGLSGDELDMAIRKAKNYKKEAYMENIFVESYIEKRAEKRAEEKAKVIAEKIAEKKAKIIAEEKVRREIEKTVLRMLAKNMDVAVISEIAGLSVKEIKKLKTQKINKRR